jgi:hypothetical protein
MKYEKERGGGRDSSVRREWKREMKRGGHEMGEMKGRLLKRKIF